MKKILRPFIPQSMIDGGRSKNPNAESYQGGHYYSTIPSLEDINKRSKEIFSRKDQLRGIDINDVEQLQILNEFRTLSSEKTFSLSETSRFNVENNSFSYDDAPVLHYMLRKIKPVRVIEIGSGNSSAVMLDTNELYLNNSIKEFTFIDIDLNNLRKRLTGNDKDRITMIEKPVQNVDLSLFLALEPNDLLFVDSSHISKVGSDLHAIIFEILPVLKPGVYIHFHDIRYPFEYSQQMINNRVYWNEAYLLRAFLMFNNNYKICFWLNYLLNKEGLAKNELEFLPLNEWDRKFNNSKGEFRGAGGSVYLRKE